MDQSERMRHMAELAELAVRVCTWIRISRPLSIKRTHRTRARGISIVVGEMEGHLPWHFSVKLHASGRDFSSLARAHNMGFGSERRRS